MASTTPAALDLNNIQGDILSGLPKKTQTYLFYQIEKTRINDFRKGLAQLIPFITTTAQAVKDRDAIAQNKKAGGGIVKLTGINIAFSQKGFKALGINDVLNDTAFQKGMLSDAETLGDHGTGTGTTFKPNWAPAFLKDIHLVLIVAADSHATVNEAIKKIETNFKIGAKDASLIEVTRIVGDVRPGKESGHEHFGFLDGISQPAVAGFDTKLNPGQEPVRQGIILLGREGDTTSRPTWANDGSFLVFRFLPQLVPEFNLFLKQNPITAPNLPPAQGSELLGARMVGRWKSGAPIDLFPLQDNPAAGTDPNKNNNFRYDTNSQERCPFAAHTRKTNPRSDLEGPTPPTGPQTATEIRRIIRRGIQFGPEVTKEEADSGKTKTERGLLFVSYQSSITNGFQFIQQSWANNTGFIFGKSVQPGFDPIIGQTTSSGPRSVVGTNPKAASASLNLPTQWVLSRGGEYFFAPSIAALKSPCAGVTGSQSAAAGAQEL